MSKNSHKRPRSILLKPLYRYRYSTSSFPNDGRERDTQSSNDYRVIQRLVSSSHECEMFHSPFFLGTSHNDDNEKDPLKNVGILGEIEVTVEEYCGPLRNGYKSSGLYGSGGGGACETLWRRVAVRGAAGSILHRTFALPSSTNDEFSLPSDHNNNDPVEAGERAYMDPIMCWTSFAMTRADIYKDFSSVGFRPQQPSFTNKKHFLCVLGLPTLLRVFDLQPSSPNPQPIHSPTKSQTQTQSKSKSKSQDKYTYTDPSTFGTEGGEGHVISLPFEATSIFSIQADYNQSNNKSHYNHFMTQGGILLQRAATQEDFFAWNQFQESQSRYPSIHYAQSHEDSPLRSKPKKSSKHNFPDEEEEDDECNISDPPHPVRLRNVFKQNLSDSPSKSIPISSSSQPLYYDEHTNDNDAFPYTPSSVTSIFSIRHPSDDIRPIALLPPHVPSISSPSLSLPSTSGPGNITPSSKPPPPLFSDAHEQVVFLGCPQSKDNTFHLPNICVTYHTQIKRHAVWILKQAPPPPQSIPLWKRTADATNEKKKSLHKMKHNMDIVLEEGRGRESREGHTNERPTHGFFSSNTTTISNSKLSPLSPHHHPEEKSEQNPNTTKTLHSSPFSDIHPDYGLSLLWTEQPLAISYLDDHSYPPRLARRSSSETTQGSSTGTVSLGRARQVFLSSDMDKSLSNLCLVCPNPNWIHAQHKQSTPEEEDLNPFVLRCLSINLLDNKKASSFSKTTTSQRNHMETADLDPANIIQSICHKSDLPCVSAQPIVSSNATDILVCSASITSSKTSRNSLKLYRGDYLICDCNLPLGGKFGWDKMGNKIRNDGHHAQSKDQDLISKSKYKGFRSTSDLENNSSMSRYLDYELEQFGHVECLAYPTYNRIDLTCMSSTSEDKTNFNARKPSFKIRSSLSLTMSTSPLAEAALLAIDSCPSIPREFSLQLRVDCITILQELPNLQKIIGMGYVDPDWKAVSIAILTIFDSYIEKEMVKLSTSKTDDETMDIIFSQSDSETPTLGGEDDDDWRFLVESEFHQTYSVEHAGLFAFENHILTSEVDHDDLPKKSQIEDNDGKIVELSCLSLVDFPITLELCSTIFDALHLVFEDSKLNRVSRGEKWIHPIGILLQKIIKRSNGGMGDFFEHFSRDIGFEKYTFEPEMSRSISESDCTFRFSHFQKVPSFFDWVESMIRGFNQNDNLDEAYCTSTFGNLNYACVLTRKIYRLYSILFDATNTDPGLILTSATTSVSEKANIPSTALSNIRNRDVRLVLAMVDEDMINLSDLTNELPTGILLPIMESLSRCRNDPPQPSSNWPPSAYNLIGRSDLAEMESIKRGLKDSPDASSISARFRGSRGEEPTNSRLQADNEKDGLLHLEMFSSMIFPDDRRIREAARLLRSSRPTYLRVDRAPEVSDHDHEGLKQEKLLLLCRRVLANSFGRGMLTFGTTQPVLTDPLPIPDLCLAGRVPPTNATLNLDISSCPDDMRIWPEFHNGVAAGLRMRIQENGTRSGGIKKITRTWILYNKPKPQSTNASSSQNRSNTNANSNNSASERTNNSHGGFLLSLGLRGQLSSLAMTDIYEYLTQGGVTTTVGILLGMAATKRSTCDPSVSKMLCLHIPSLLPPSFSVMEVASAAQAAAIAGIGLLYQGSSHRLMTEFLLNEMGRKPSSDYSTHDREGYTLACGLALGMVNLSTSETSETRKNQKIGAGLADLHIEERLNRYIVGGNDDVDTQLRREAAERSSSVGSNAGESERCSRIYEGTTINTDVTAPGATLALGLIYLKSGNYPVAAILNLPDTHFLLDYVRPDLLMYRVISRALILWDYVSPTSEWIDNQIPLVVRKIFSDLEKQALRASDFIGILKNSSMNEQQVESDKKHGKDSIDRQAVRQIHTHVVAGACFGMGLRYAGTANARAASAIAERIKIFRKLRDDNDPVSVAQRPERPILEMCLGCAAIALAMVMAGTGDVETMRLLRELRWRCDEDVRYGNHMAYGAAIGLLFLGGGSCTLSSEPADIAALLMAFFPRFPAHTSDNQYHLQALRHFYVLAARNRELEAIDVDTREPVYVPFEVQFLDDKVKPMKLKTPCLLPSQHEISCLRINSDRYFPVIVDANYLRFNQNGQNLNSSGSILVKKKSGVLSYAQDPHSLRSLLVQSGVSKSGSILKMIKSFTDDPRLLAFVQYVCEGRHDYMYRNESKSLNPYGLGMGHTLEMFCASVLYECLTEGKTDVFPLFLSLWCCILSLQETHKANVAHIWDIRLLEAYYEGYKEESLQRKHPQRLFHDDFIAMLKENVTRIFVDNGFNETQIKYYQKFKEFESNGIAEGKLFGCFLVWNKL